jgi:hypothetical protein
MLAGSGSVYFVTRRGRVSTPGAFQESLCLGDIAPLSALTEILLGPQGRQLLRHSDVDELVQRHSFGFRNTARLFEY